MRTIIPFPTHVSHDDGLPASDLQAESLVPFPHMPEGREAVTDQVDLEIPEGETMSARIAGLPRARAMQDDITRLISAIHRRFG